MILIQESLDFEFLSADSMGFIPMELSRADLAALEPYHGKPLEFSPSPWPVLLLKTHYITNVASDGHSLNLFDFTNYLKNHKDCTLLVSTILFAPNDANQRRANNLSENTNTRICAAAEFAGLCPNHTGRFLSKAIQEQFPNLDAPSLDP